MLLYLHASFGAGSGMLSTHTLPNGVTIAPQARIGYSSRMERRNGSPCLRVRDMQTFGVRVSDSMAETRWRRRPDFSWVARAQAADVWFTLMLVSTLCALLPAGAPYLTLPGGQLGKLLVKGLSRKGLELYLP